MLATLTFLEKYLSATNFNNNECQQEIDGYCDNNGLIQLMQERQNSKIPQPALAISNDYDLVNEIYQTIQHIPLPIRLHHVKGRQDQNTPIEELPYPARLNIECDTRARKALENLPINISPHLSLPASYPHLQICKQMIVRQIPEYLREAATLPTYNLYLQNKFHWADDIISTIEW